jgi:nucleoside-diphosphate kinase
MPYAGKNERTLVIIKPDGIQRTLIGEIIKRYEQIGLKMIASKIILWIQSGEG